MQRMKTKLVLLDRLLIGTDKTFVECGGLQFLIQSTRIGLHESIPDLFIIITLIFRLIFMLNNFAVIRNSRYKVRHTQ